MGMCVIGLIVIVLLRRVHKSRDSGWATYTSGILVLILFQLLVLLLTFVFMILQGRDQMHCCHFGIVCSSSKGAIFRLVSAGRWIRNHFENFDGIVPVGRS